MSGRLSDAEVAAPATFIRGAWTNDAGKAIEESVTKGRGQL